MKRAVAIVGRPNVGKSSIFNRLGKRTAIIHPERGVTRDSIVQEAEWNGARFDLIDTGGLEQPGGMENGEHSARLARHVRRQVEIAVENACAIIFVVDAESGAVPQDEETAAFLRKSGKPVLLAANKADNEGRDVAASDFDRFGFPVFPVSAVHYRGFEPLMGAVVRQLPAGDTPTGKKDPLKVTIVGHPNVGKSSFVNRLLGFERVIVSEAPGTTRDSIDTQFTIGSGNAAHHYVLTDTPGMRSARKLRDALEHFSMRSAERSIARSDVAVLVLDAAQGPTSQDKKIASLILRHRKGCAILVNKWDLKRDAGAARYRKALREALPFLDFVPVVMVSAKTGFNVGRAIETIDAVAACNDARLGTGVLNRVIQQACERKQPPIIGAKRLKIYYAVQIGRRPATIALFMNSPRRLPQAYESYLANVLRRAFGLEGTPIAFKAKEK